MIRESQIALSRLHSDGCRRVVGYQQGRSGEIPVEMVVGLYLYIIDTNTKLFLEFLSGFWSPKNTHAKQRSTSLLVEIQHSWDVFRAKD